MKNKIYACLWSDGQAIEMAKYYCSVLTANWFEIPEAFSLLFILVSLLVVV